MPETRRRSRPELINLTVNGKPRSTEDSIQLEAYLMSFGVNLDHVAVGYNGEVIKKEEFAKVSLRDGDVLEIVRPVGGG
ncbi:MAG TPA: sulfur carrier protein ThiS [Gemmatimonadetes bacterium]|nr:sulfur carrier protein ThiS [Gemmatimonadota bacterium]